MTLRKLAETVPKSLVNDILRCSLMKQTGVSLNYMMNIGPRPTSKNLLLSAQFLRKELPKRLACRVLELENLPYGLSSKAPVLKPIFQYNLQGTMIPISRCICLVPLQFDVSECQVRDWYVESFKDLCEFPEIQGSEDELRFTDMINQIKVRHNKVVPTMAMGVQLIKQDLGHKIGLNDLPEVHQFLDRFYMSRIGVRMLIGQHVALHEPDPLPGYIGLICTRTSPMKVAQRAIDDARSLCMNTYGSAPQVHVYGDPNFTFPVLKLEWACVCN
eukprot:Gb_36900 [translate_table: standard]